MLAQTDQAYVYAGDDPVNNSDPSGLHVCNGNPITWLGCIGNAAGSVVSSAVSSAIGSAVQPSVNSAISQINSAASSGSNCGSGTATTGLAAAGAERNFWDRAPDWVGLDVSGTWLAIFAEVDPPLALLTGGAQFIIDRYGDAYLGPQAGVSVTGYVALADAGWVWQNSVPSSSYLNNFISGLSFAGQIFIGGGGGVAGTLVYGNVGQWGRSAFGVQVGLGAGVGHSASGQASWLFSLGNLGVSW